MFFPICFHIYNRYRNFRTFTSPRPSQFSCLAVDSSGEIVSAGSQDSFEIFIWSMQSGRLLDVRTHNEHLSNELFLVAEVTQILLKYYYATALGKRIFTQLVVQNCSFLRIFSRKLRKCRCYYKINTDCRKDFVGAK